jgi:hypothetical protein
VQRHDTPSTWRFIFNYPGAVHLELSTSIHCCKCACAITPHSLLLLPLPVVIVRIVTSYIVYYQIGQHWDERIIMPFQHRPQEAHSEAAEPLYRDSSDNAEKPTQHDVDEQTQALRASIRRLRRWLIAVSVLLGLVCAYTLFSFRHVVRDIKATKQLAFAPESKSSKNR